MTYALPPGSPWDWGELSADQFKNLAALPADGPDAPLFQYAAVRACLARRAAVEAGDGFEILACVRQCGTHGLVMPLWLVSAFNRRFDAVLNGRAISWDDPLSFGRPYLKGTHKNAVAKSRMNRVKVWLAVNDAVMTGRSVSEELFAEIAESIRSNSTDVKKLYREAKERLGLHDPVMAKREMDHLVSNLNPTLRRKLSKSNDVKKKPG